MLNLAYLFDPRPGPLPPHDLQLIISLMAILALGLCASTYLLLAKRAVGPTKWLILSQIPLSGCTLLLMSARLLNIPYLSTRALLYEIGGLCALAWAILLLRGARQGSFLRGQLGLLTFSWQGVHPPTPSSAAIVLLAGHLVGIVFLSVHLGRSFIYLLAVLLILGTPQLVATLRAKRWKGNLEALTPLYFAYLA
ncbi:MAG: hypothetical protein OEV76_05940, partial [Anaerolineae bacterium]|nr:hypothetical protein [Anaerolineae bacterium]